MLAGNVHKLRESCAGADVDGVVAFFSDQFIDGDRATDDDVGLEFHSHFAHVVELFADDVLGQAEFRDAIDQDAAEFVQRFEYANLVAFLDEIACNGKSRRTAAHNGNFFPCG